MSTRVSKAAVIAFRLEAHGLTERSGEDTLLDVAGRCGVQNSPPGSALLALHARLRGLTQEKLDTLVAKEKSLLQSWCMRGSPFFFPTVDAPVFTTGVLPPTEEAMRRLVLGVEQAVDKLGMSLTEAVELTRAEIRDVLTGRQLAIDELGAELAERIARKLPQSQRDLWEAEGPYAKGQPLGEAVVHFCVRILTLQRVVCFVPRAENKAPFALVDEWLGQPIPEVDPKVARAELLRRYLRCYGPSTRKDFAAWLGVRTGDADHWWSLLEDELVPVELDGKQAWILADDLDRFESPSVMRGLRLLPPSDPYTQMRDRDTIVDRRHQREVWKTVGAPGAVLADGEIVGTWRPRKSGRTLTLTVKTFRPLGSRSSEHLREEAGKVAQLRGAAALKLDIE